MVNKEIVNLRMFAFKVFIHVSSSFAAIAHRQNYRSATTNDVATGKHFRN